ncbi:MAG: urease accessory protein UreD [Burkholderiales bacterium]|nr:urease accessory protein UreD [Burkholderiales bacterium]
MRYRQVLRDAGPCTLAHDRHEGPLRVLQPLYPEGPAICHQVIVHPPGGVVGGDELHIDARLEAGAHALVTTPGATRFYRSDGAVALQRVRLQLAAGARLEWLPLETIAYSGCEAETSLVAELAPGAEMIGWELLVLGLPAAGAPFVAGRWRQHLELPGRWLDRARIAGDDTALLDAPAGWAGRRVLGTAWFAAGGPLAGARRDALLEAARDVLAASALRATAGMTAPQPGVLVLRLLAHEAEAEAAMQLLAAVRAAWRAGAWALAAEPPRIWRT